MYSIKKEKNCKIFLMGKVTRLNYFTFFYFQLSARNSLFYLAHIVDSVSVILWYLINVKTAKAQGFGIKIKTVNVCWEAVPRGAHSLVRSLKILSLSRFLPLYLALHTTKTRLPQYGSECPRSLRADFTNEDSLLFH